MFHSFVAVALCFAGPVHENIGTLKDYFVFKVGSVWVYDTTLDDLKSVVTVTKLETKDDVTLIDMTQKIGSDYRRQTRYKVANDEVIPIEIDKEKIADPFKVISFPLTESKSEFKSKTRTNRYEVKWTKVTVPLNTYHAYEVYHYTATGNFFTETKTWYVKDIGIVKTEFRIKSSGDWIERNLLSYKLGK